MGFLQPWLLALGAAVAVPLILHLLQRHQGPRLVFPALRYLRRAETEHARRIRLRQLLLLALRVAGLLLLALAAARPVARRGGAAHEPTAAVIILDNSLSSGLVQGDRRVLEVLKQRALETLARGRPEDRFWLIRAGVPGEPALPGDAVSTAQRVRVTEVTAGAAELSIAVQRARALLSAGAEGRATEIHVLSDLQASGFSGTVEGDEGAPPLVVWAPRRQVPANRAVADVQVGGGVAPRAGERSSVAATIVGAGARDSLSLRLLVEGRVAAAAVVAGGSGAGDTTARALAALLPFPPRGAGLVTGWVEIDPDALRADDRRYFAVRIQPPPTVALAEPLPFVEQALDVLADAGRLRRVPPPSADLVVAPAAAGAEAVRRGRTALVLAPASSIELPAANRRLAAAGIPWRLGPPAAGGESRVGGVRGDEEMGKALEGTRIHEAYVLERRPSAEPDTVLLRLHDGAPWVVAGETAGGGRYLLVASALSTEATTLPTSAAMLPLLDRLLGAWAAAQPPRAEAAPGGTITVPPEARTIVRPDGERETVAGGAAYSAPAIPGIYRVLAGDRLVDGFAVNPPAAESDLTRLDGGRIAALFPGWPVEAAADPGAWRAAVYRRRVGREVWRPLVLAALGILLMEGLLAAAGAAPRRAARAGAEILPAEPEPAPRRGSLEGETSGARHSVAAEPQAGGR
ncbi:MAG: BatA domain-containing protein [Gemmatimonadetes bacterium]|nr:BatA domain-containing protein [Gemmatimonadota bacterium]